MKANKFLLLIATLSFVALATPSFAQSYGNNSLQGSRAAVSQYTPWDGGGSNAMSVNVNALAADFAGQTQASLQYTPWDGGGSNATAQRVAAGTSAPAAQKPLAFSRVATWDGGGSNAMTGLD